MRKTSNIVVFLWFLLDYGITAFWVLLFALYELKLCLVVAAGLWVWLSCTAFVKWSKRTELLEQCLKHIEEEIDDAG